MEPDQRDRKRGEVAAILERDVARLPARVELALEERQPADIVGAAHEPGRPRQAAFLGDGGRVVEAGERRKPQRERRGACRAESACSLREAAFERAGRAARRPPKQVQDPAAVDARGTEGGERDRRAVRVGRDCDRDPVEVGRVEVPDGEPEPRPGCGGPLAVDLDHRRLEGLTLPGRDSGGIEAEGDAALPGPRDRVAEVRPLRPAEVEGRQVDDRFVADAERPQAQREQVGPALARCLVDRRDLVARPATRHERGPGGVLGAGRARRIAERDREAPVSPADDHRALAGGEVLLVGSHLEGKQGAATVLAEDAVDLGLLGRARHGRRDGPERDEGQDREREPHRQDQAGEEAVVSGEPGERADRAEREDVRERPGGRGQPGRGVRAGGGKRQRQCHVAHGGERGEHGQGDDPASRAGRCGWSSARGRATSTARQPARDRRRDRVVEQDALHERGRPEHHHRQLPGEPLAAPQADGERDEGDRAEHRAERRRLDRARAAARRRRSAPRGCRAR